MMKWAMGLAFAAALFQDSKPPGLPPRQPNDCDMAKEEMAPFCTECQVVLDGDYAKEHKENKELKNHPIKSRKVCVKKYYYAECHPENNSFDKGECCGAKKVEKTSKAVIVWRCEGCSSTLDDEKQQCGAGSNGGSCSGKKRKDCANTPTFPHVNEKNWRAEQKKKKK